jgi:amino acid transporter
MLKKIEEVLLGKAKNPLDTSIFHQISLVAFLAWIGLGADGLSSSAYGPEEAFIALSGHKYLALYLVLATTITIFTITFSYNQIIELFPNGGGGYTVVSKLLGPYWGLICGSALVVDYVLTIAISVAAGVDAVFSFFPTNWFNHKLITGMIIVSILIWLNMRGIKESIKTLAPIFLTFIITHLFLIITGIALRHSHITHTLHNVVTETHSIVQTSGSWTLMVLLLTAYSMGGGTYTGIEAVSNGLNQLRQPRVRTGKLTMIYMACSLAIAAGGILFLYVLWDINHIKGKTMNAVLIDTIFQHLEVFGLPLFMSKGLILITLLSESLLLFVAAQTGFIDGPNVVSNMSADYWMPSRFANLSVRLVRQNGIILMGAAALAVLWYTNGNVSKLVVLYSINVFITFTLSQFAMAKHWWQVKAKQADWYKRFAINGIGTLLTGTILITTTIIKFTHGGWVTLVVTGSLVALCYSIYKHYDNVKLALRRLDDLLVNLPLNETCIGEPIKLDTEGPTAVLLVKNYDGLGIHAIFSIMRLFRTQKFKNLLFISVGHINAPHFTDHEEINKLRSSIEYNLDRYVDLAQRMGYYSERRYALGTDRVAELEKLCSSVSNDFIEPVFFCGKLIFAEETSWTAFLHNQTPMEIQRRLMFAGFNTVVVPVRVL